MKSSIYAYVRTVNNIENLSVMSLARFPESVQLTYQTTSLLDIRSFALLAVRS